MTDVLILADVDHQEGSCVPCSMEQGMMIDALQQAIAADAALSSGSYTVHLSSPQQRPTLGRDALICPLTLNVPSDLQFAGQAIYQICQDIAGLRQWVRREWGLLTGEGDLWLPVALTAKGPLYGEVIGSEAANSAAQADSTAIAYYQPLHLSDRLRQPLYGLAGQLLRSHLAPPAVYLMQFKFEGTAICFDRLFPFPAAPAIASIGVQVPNLFAAHWRCITRRSLQDLVIPGFVPHRVVGE
ncbi:hypothetical protein H6G89_07195 [Oscillatoria sp. FACHB-1407]|uniref:hypothetical protein n=1 Tax=Oscillatoria sp. FACHB-1407 TaxID=2692847 RepID=UPI001683AE40|nr:hypothetical protein [Oscillatoria sp. FACHB-1407]MBD2460827.1 hypothetical protein [Oscillatoria sp. FACHB-1407]